MSTFFRQVELNINKSSQIVKTKVIDVSLQEVSVEVI